MAEAKITLSLTPQEFDLMRAAMENEISRQQSIIGDRSATAAGRDVARRKVLGLTDINKKLR